MQIIFEQVFLLLAMGAAGFILARCGIADHRHAGILSKLLVYLFLPANIIKTFARNCTVAYIGQNAVLILLSLGVIAVLAMAGHLGAKLFSKDPAERSVYEYSLVIPNFGYMGYTLAEVFFGAAGLMNAMMFAIPMSLYTYTFGYCTLSGKRLSPKNLINPTMISLVIGIILGLSGLGTRLPDVAFSFLNSASACMAPVSMLLTGIVISEFGILRIAKNPRIYIITALRLLVIPLAVGGILSLFGNTEAVIAAVLLYAMPCGLNTVVFVKNAGGNCEPGAGLALVSNILACLTIPLVFLIFGINL